MSMYNSLCNGIESVTDNQFYTKRYRIEVLEETVAEAIAEIKLQTDDEGAHDD